MSIHRVNTTPGASVTRVINGRETLLHALITAPTATELITGVALSRTVRGTDVKIRPTSVTANLIIEQPAGEYTEIIMLQNGPKGGFVQNGFQIGPHVSVFVNGSVEAVITQDQPVA